MGHKDNGLALSKLDISTSKIAFCIIYHGYREGGAWDGSYIGRLGTPSLPPSTTLNYVKTFFVL